MPPPPTPPRRPLLREPLVHFLAIGALLYALDVAAMSSEAPAEGDGAILVTEDFVRAVRADLERTTGRADAAAVQAAIDRFVEEEAFVREARRMGLDDGDLVVRRRLVQKMEFLVGDVAVAPEPTEPELHAWLSEHADRYRSPARVSFEHVYFSRDRRGPSAAGDARAALEAGVPEGAGDPFLLGRRFEAVSRVDVARQFGAAFAEAVAAAAPGDWAGPVSSAYGEHLVRVTTVTPGSEPDLEQVRARVRADLREGRRADAERAARRAIRERYEVRVEAPPVPGSDE